MADDNFKDTIYQTFLDAYEENEKTSFKLVYQFILIVKEQQNYFPNILEYDDLVKEYHAYRSMY